MLLTAESHPKIFQVGGKGSGKSKYVSLTFFNVVGNSEPARPAFESVRIEASTSLAGASNRLLIYFVANFMILK